MINHRKKLFEWKMRFLLNVMLNTFVSVAKTTGGTGKIFLKKNCTHYNECSYSTLMLLIIKYITMKISKYVVWRCLDTC